MRIRDVKRRSRSRKLEHRATFLYSLSTVSPRDLSFRDAGNFKLGVHFFRLSSAIRRSWPVLSKFRISKSEDVEFFIRKNLLRLSRNSKSSRTFLRKSSLHLFSRSKTDRDIDGFPCANRSSRQRCSTTYNGCCALSLVVTKSSIAPLALGLGENFKDTFVSEFHEGVHFSYLVLWIRFRDLLWNGCYFCSKKFESP